jgi:hypothetical protein
MQPSLNQPYRKQLKSDGSIINPITIDEPYIAYAPNRKARRESLNQTRFINNHAGVHLTVASTAKYYRVRQMYKTKGGEIVEILHYLQG